MSGVFHLKGFGVKKKWQKPFIFPWGYSDFTCWFVVEDLLNQERPGQVLCHVSEPGRVQFGTRFLAELADPEGTVFKIDTPLENIGDQQQKLQEVGQEVALFGRFVQRKRRIYMEDPIIVPEKWQERVRPEYPVPSRWKVLANGPAKIRDMMLEDMEEVIPETAELLAVSLTQEKVFDQSYSDVKSELIRVLSQIHWPSNEKGGWECQENMLNIKEKLVDSGGWAREDLLLHENAD